MCREVDFEVFLVDSHFICISKDSSDFFERQTLGVREPDPLSSISLFNGFWMGVLIILP
jgi:hypothetical protein